MVWTINRPGPIKAGLTGLISDPARPDAGQDASCHWPKTWPGSAEAVPLIPDRLRNTTATVTMAPNTLILQYWVIDTVNTNLLRS